jgi:hypothetical protein
VVTPTVFRFFKPFALTDASILSFAGIATATLLHRLPLCRNPDQDREIPDERIAQFPVFAKSSLTWLLGDGDYRLTATAMLAAWGCRRPGAGNLDPAAALHQEA